jgi:hypothetical protein
MIRHAFCKLQARRMRKRIGSGAGHWANLLMRECTRRARRHHHRHCFTD